MTTHLPVWVRKGEGREEGNPTLEQQAKGESCMCPALSPSLSPLARASPEQAVFRAALGLNRTFMAFGAGLADSWAGALPFWAVNGALSHFLLI